MSENRHEHKCPCCGVQIDYNLICCANCTVMEAMLKTHDQRGAEMRRAFGMPPLPTPTTGAETETTTGEGDETLRGQIMTALMDAPSCNGGETPQLDCVACADTVAQRVESVLLSRLAAAEQKNKGAGKLCTCVYCAHSEPYFSTDMQEVGRVRGLMIAHDRVCPKNPLVAEITALLSRLAAAEQKNTELEAERDEANAQCDALGAKIESLAPHGTCGCSYDKPGDLCLHHAPRLAALEARVRELSEEKDTAVRQARQQQRDEDVRGLRDVNGYCDAKAAEWLAAQPLTTEKKKEQTP